MASAAITKLLGETLVRRGGEEAPAPTAEYVAIYFSASWCGPCVGFTPELVKFYEKHKADKSLEIVFCSADRDEESFKGYLQKMPWLAVPFADEKRRAKLSSKFKVQGIPTLVLVEAATGKLITTNGRARVSNDPEAAEFPWPTKPTRELLPDELVAPDGKRVPTASTIAEDYLLIYFSASWCPPCKQFSPVLAATYKRLKSQGKSFECIFASSDRDQASFDAYREELGFYAIPFEERGAKAAISERFGVSGIPTLIILDPRTDKVINASGRAAVSTDPAGEDFPWHPKPVNELTGGTAGSLQDLPALIAFFQDDTPGAVRDATVAALNEVAAARKAARGEDDDEGDSVGYYFAGSDPIVPRVRQVMGGRVASGGVSLAILNLAAGASHESDIAKPEDITAASITAFLAQFDADAVDASPLQGGQ